jgi:hypothetical protein
VALHCPAPRSCRGASPGIAIQDTEEGANGGKKRHKLCCKEVATDDDFGINERAGDFSVGHAVEVVGSRKHQARLPMDHLEKLLEETCPNHAFPDKHKFRDCGLMKSFMTSGSLSQGMEVNEVPVEGDTAPFPREYAVMTIYGRHPSPERRRMPDPSLGTLAH